MTLSSRKNKRNPNGSKIYYLPYRSIICEDQTTNKNEDSFFEDSSNETHFPSLNGSLSLGLNLIWNILIFQFMFRLNKIAITERWLEGNFWKLFCARRKKHSSISMDYWKFEPCTRSFKNDMCKFKNKIEFFFSKCHF